MNDDFSIPISEFTFNIIINNDYTMNNVKKIAILRKDKKKNVENFLSNKKLNNFMSVTHYHSYLLYM